MALEVGTVLGRLGARLDTDGFDRFDRRMDKARRDAERPITAHAKASADTRELDRYQKRLDTVDDGHQRVAKSGHGLAGSLGGVAKTAAVVAGPTALLAVGVGLGKAFGAYKETERIGRQTNAVLKSTGEQAGVTAKHVENLATKISRKTGIDDEAIQSSENLLLTFTNVRNEVGKGNDVFDQATQAVTDMSAALGQDGKSSAIQLGKALNDPIKGVTALQRVGVSFTAQQKDQIKTLVGSGKTLQAQKIILGEVQKEFGGSAAATATNTGRLKVSLGNLAEGVGKVLSPAIEKGAGLLNHLAEGLADGSVQGSSFGRWVKGAAQTIGVVFAGAVRIGGKALDGLKTIIRDNATTLRGIGTTVAGVAKAWVAFARQIIDAARDTFGGKSGTSRDIQNIIGKLLLIVGAAEKVNAAVVKRILPGIAQAFRGFAQILRGLIRIISGLLSGDFGKAWDGVQDLFKGALRALAGIVRAGTAPIRTAAAAIGSAVGGAFSSAWSGITSTARGFVNGIIDVLNIIPGVNIHHVGGGSNRYSGSGGAGSGGGGINAQGGGGRQQGVGTYAEGGKVTAPIAIMGEEAPQHPEWVIPTNPAYRGRALGLWAAAARELGIPGFALGGLFDPGKALDFVTGLPGKAVSTAAGIAGKLLPKLPGNPGGILGGAFDYALDKAGDFITGKAAGLAKAAASVVSSGGGGGASTSGLVPQVLRALAWARGHGWHGGVNSGFRTYAEQAVLYQRYLNGGNLAAPPGQSNHESGRAVDVSDIPGFQRAMASAPPSARLIWFGPGDPVHFSVDGHRRGGRIGALGALGGERLASGALAFKKGGKTVAQRVRSAVGNTGTIRHREHGIQAFETELADRERTYGQTDRRFGLTDEVLLIENPDGSTTVDQRALTRRTGELGELERQRQNIRDRVKAYRAAAKRLADNYRAAIKRLQRALAAAKGKARRKERQGYRDEIATYQTRIGELKTLGKDLGFELEDQNIDLAEIRGELAEVKGTTGAPAPAKEPEAAGDAPGDSSSGDTTSTPDPAPAAPTALDIATGVAEALASFNAGRADLFSQFGANFIGAGAGAPTAAQLAAGARYFGGGTGGSDGGVAGAAGAPGGVQLNVTFTAPQPPDPHTFAQAALFELQAAV